MKKINNLITAFVPPEAYDDAESFRLNKFFVSSCFITAGFALGYFFMSIYLDGILFAEAMIVSVIVFLSLPVLLRRGLPLSILAEVFIADIAIVVVLLIYWGGGIRTANLAPWPLVVPLFAMLMQGPQKSIKWLVYSLSVIFIFSYFTFQHIVFPIRFDVAEDPLFNMLSLAGLVCIVTTIFYISEKEKRQAQRELKERNIQLENLNREKDNFLRIVSHDLKSPVLIVTEFAKYLSEPDLSEEDRKEYIGHITSAGDRMLELIRNLLDINVIEAGKMTVRKKAFSLNDLIKKYADQVSMVAKSRKINLHVILPDREIEIISDKSRMEQVLDNYVSNAMKYCPDDTDVYIQLSESDTYIELSVRDEGPGIAPHELAKLFVPFSVASSAPRAGDHSSGLGLAIVKKIGDSIGGTVGGISDIGEGSTFYIRLPRQATGKTRLPHEHFN